MRSKKLTRWVAVLAALALTLWLVSPTWAESGCHKVKGKGGGSTQAVQTVG
jgi:hypothetical protein